ncbi:MAG: DivIVA domain-containing protein [Clostridium sp.]
MKLTPMDINNKEFKKGLRGYNSDEVDEFLDEIVENYEEIYKENSRLKDQVNSLKEQIQSYSNIENTIQKTLVMAQNAADEAKASAQKDAEVTIKNANDTAQRILDKAHNDVIQINDDYESVKQEFIKFRNKYRNFMKTQLETFDELEKDFNKNYSISTPVEEAFVEEKGIELTQEIINIADEVINEEMDEIKSFFAKSNE